MGDKQTANYLVTPLGGGKETCNLVVGWGGEGKGRLKLRLGGKGFKVMM